MQSSDLVLFPHSKLAAPCHFQRPIPRKRLFRQLGSGSRLLLVTAPAGFGKSSLLASWISEPDRSLDRWQPAQSADHRFVWYNLDEADADAARLIDGLAAAFERTAPGTGIAARQMLASGANLYAALASLLAQAERTPATVVLDNCQHLDGSREAERVVNYLIANCPATLRLVLASRGIPLIPAVSAVMAGNFNAIGREDLQFQGDDAAALAEQHGLPGDQVAAAVHSVSGWAMGIVLLAHAQVGNITFLQRPLDMLADYLTSEIVDQLPESTRRFVLESAVLGTFDEGAADAILERTGSALDIEYLLRRGIFLDSFPSPGGYLVGFHDMFGAAMAARLQRIDPRRYSAIHRRAAEYYASDPHRALVHSAKLMDPAHLAQQLSRFLPALRQAGNWEALVRYGELLPAAFQPLMLQRVLSFAYYTRGDDRAALATADRVLSTAIALDDQEARFSALALRANPHFRQERYAELLSYCLPALHEAHDAGLSSAECWLAWIVSKALLREGRVQEGSTMIKRTLDLYRSISGPAARLSMAFFEQDVAPVLLEIGECGQAERLISEASAIARDVDDRTLVTACLATRSEILLLRGEFIAAADLAELTAELTAREGSPVSHYTALRTQARAWAALHRHDEARKALERYVAFVSTWPSAVQLQAELIRIRLAVLADDARAARDAIESVAVLDPSQRSAAQVSLEAGAIALLEGRDRDADPHLAAAIDVLAKYALRPRAALALVLRAQVQARLGKQARAAVMLSQAAELACEAEWLPWLVNEALSTVETLKDVESYWRIQGKARKLLDALLEAMETTRLTIMPPRTQAVASPGDAEGPIIFVPFGSGTLRQGDTESPLAGVGSEKARETLAFVIWQARPLHRDEILEAVWEGRVDDQTLSAFRKAGYQIRRFFGEQAWLRSKSTYTFTPAVDDAYRALLAMAVGIRDLDRAPEEIAGLANRALSLYAAPYLSWCYSDWVEEPRGLAETAALTLIEALARARRELGQPLMALEALERGLVMQPYRESLRRAHITVLIELGRPVDAAASFRRHLQILREEELGAPSGEFLKLRTVLPQTW